MVLAFVHPHADDMQVTGPELPRRSASYSQLVPIITWNSLERIQEDKDPRQTETRGLKFAFALG